MAGDGADAECDISALQDDSGMFAADFGNDENCLESAGNSNEENEENKEYEENEDCEEIIGMMKIAPHLIRYCNRYSKTKCLAKNPKNLR
jgi:hypothetical protein